MDEKLIKAITLRMEEYGMPKFVDRYPAIDILQLVKDAGYSLCQEKPDPKQGLSVEEILNILVDKDYEYYLEMDKRLDSIPWTDKPSKEFIIEQSRIRLNSTAQAIHDALPTGDVGELVDLLKRANEELKLELEAVGGCDHAVNICSCELGRLIEDISDYLSKFERWEKP